MVTHLELRVREALKNRGELLQHPDKRKIANQTAALLLELLASIRVVCLGEQRAIAKPVGPHVKRILELAGFDETIYTVVPSLKWVSPTFNSVNVYPRVPNTPVPWLSQGIYTLFRT